MKSVRSSFRRDSRLRMASGTVESSTESVGKPFLFPKTRRVTSEQRLEPPMPRTTMSSKSRRTDSAKARMSLAFFDICSTTVSQPRALLMIFLCASSLFQRVASFFQMRSTKFSFSMR